MKTVLLVLVLFMVGCGRDQNTPINFPQAEPAPVCPEGSIHKYIGFNYCRCYDKITSEDKGVCN